MDPSDSPTAPDPESAALTEVGRRARTTRVSVGVPVLVLGIALGIAGYFALRALFFESIGAHSPYVTGVLSMLPAMTLAWWLGAELGRLVVVLRSPAWIAELSASHGVSPGRTFAPRSGDDSGMRAVERQAVGLRWPKM